MWTMLRSTFPEISSSREAALGSAVLLLGVGLAVNAVLGPMALGLIRYPVSDSMRNQTIGIDAATLAVVTPACLVLGYLLLRSQGRLRGSGGGALALGPGLFATYMVPQYVVGPDYLGRTGNSHRFFLLHLALFVLGGVVSVLAWSAVNDDELPPMTPRIRRVARTVLLCGAGFLVFGLHLRGLVDGLHRVPASRAFRDDPTAFSFVKLLDLGVIVPASIYGAAALLLDLRSARRLLYSMIGWLTLDAIAVFSMAVTMNLNDDVNKSSALAAGFGVLALALLALDVALVRPLLSNGRSNLQLP
jgi:hypothetical protein